MNNINFQTVLMEDGSVVFNGDIDVATFQRCFNILKLYDQPKVNEKLLWPVFKVWFETEFGDEFPLINLKEVFSATNFSGEVVPLYFGRLLMFAIKAYFAPEVYSNNVQFSGFNFYLNLNKKLAIQNGTEEFILVREVTELMHKDNVSVDQLAKMIDIVGYYVPEINALAVHLFCGSLPREDLPEFPISIRAHNLEDLPGIRNYNILDVVHKYKEFKKLHVKTWKEETVHLAVGGAKKCSHCGKKKHTVDKCWKLHPELNPYNKSKKKKKEEIAASASGEGLLSDNDGMMALGFFEEGEQEEHFCGMVEHEVLDLGCQEVDEYTLDLMGITNDNIAEGNVCGLDGIIGSGLADGEESSAEDVMAALHEKSHFKQNKFLIDSGASIHLVNNPNLLKNKRPGSISIKSLHNKVIYNVVGDLEFPNNLTLKNVVYAKDSPTNIVSLTKLNSMGYNSSQIDCVCRIYRNKEVVCETKLEDNCYYINENSFTRLEKAFMVLGSNTKNISYLKDYSDEPDEFIDELLNEDFDDDSDDEYTDDIITDEPDWMDAHVKGGHLSKNQLEKQGYKVEGNVKQYCTTCAGIVNKTLGTESTEINDVGELLHVDLIGPIYKKYGLVCIDNKSKYVVGYIMDAKSEASAKTINVIKMLNNHLKLNKRSIVRVRADNEFRTKLFQDFCTSKGISVEYTAPHSSYQNGTVENANRLIKRKLRLLLVQSGIPRSLWMYAFKHAIFLLNYFPRGTNDDSPWKIFSGKEKLVKNIIPFGCLIFYYNYNNDQKVFTQYKSGVFLGYDNTSKIALVYDVAARKIIRTSAFQAYEAIFPLRKPMWFENDGKDSKRKYLNGSSSDIYAEDDGDNQPISSSRINTYGGGSFGGSFDNSRPSGPQPPAGSGNGNPQGSNHSDSADSSDGENSMAVEKTVCMDTDNISDSNSENESSEGSLSSSNNNNTSPRSRKSGSGAKTGKKRGTRRSARLAARANPGAIEKTGSMGVDSDSSADSSSGRSDVPLDVPDSQTPPLIENHPPRQLLEDVPTDKDEADPLVAGYEKLFNTMNQQWQNLNQAQQNQHNNLLNQYSNFLHHSQEFMQSQSKDQYAYMDKFFNKAGQPIYIPVESDLLHPTDSSGPPSQLPPPPKRALLQTRGQASRDLITKSKDNALYPTTTDNSSPPDSPEPESMDLEDSGSPEPAQLPPPPTRKQLKASDNANSKPDEFTPPPPEPSVTEVSTPGITNSIANHKFNINLPPYHLFKSTFKRRTVPGTETESTDAAAPKRRIQQGIKYHLNETDPDGNQIDRHAHTKKWVNLSDPERNYIKDPSFRGSVYMDETVVNVQKDLLKSQKKLLSQQGEGGEMDQDPAEEKEEHVHLLVNKHKYTIPNTYKQAMNTPEAEKWDDALGEELGSIVNNKVFTKVKRKDVPKDALIVKSRLVFNVKLVEKENKKGSTDANDYEEKFKVRLVAKGFTQEHGVNYMDKYAPVMRFDTLRLVMSIAGMKNWGMKQMDAKNAFLNGDLDYPVYLQPPDGVEKSSDIVWKLNKSLYGLKQSPRIWYLTLAKVLTDNGFKSCVSDPCLFWKRNCLILLYVDDILITGKTSEDINKAANILKSKFVMKDMGQPKMFLGININKLSDNKGYSLSLEDTISRIQEDLNITESQRKLQTPMAKGFDKNPIDSPLLNYKDHRAYRSIIGSLLYLANTVRLDIQFAVSYLSRFLEKPTEYHLKGAERVVQYIIQTKNFKLTYGPKDNKLEYKDFRFVDKTEDVIIRDYPNKGSFDLVVVSDTDWAGDIADRKSQSGHLVYFNGNIVSWSSKKQDGTALSSTESEYIGLSEAAKSGLNVKNVLEELQIKIPLFEIVGDNIGALTLASHNTQHRKTKHIDLRYHHVRDLIETKAMRPNYINTKINPADMLTKFIDSTTFIELSKYIN